MAFKCIMVFGSVLTGNFQEQVLVHGLCIRFAKLLLTSIHQKWYHCNVNTPHSVQEWRVVIK